MPSLKSVIPIAFVVLACILGGILWVQKDSTDPLVEQQVAADVNDNNNKVVQHEKEAAVEKTTADIVLAPHKALYQATLKSVHSGAQIVDASGKIYYKLDVDCNFYQSENQFNMVYQYADSKPLRITSDFSNFEAIDNSAFDFNVIRKRNGVQYEEVRGNASMPLTKGGEVKDNGEAIFRRPVDMEQDLPAGTLFPTVHTYNVLKKIKQGQRFYNAIVFDGSDMDGPVEINMVYLGPVDDDTQKQALGGTTEGQSNNAIQADLLKSPAHKLRMAFFNYYDQAEEADYEITLTLHENGIVSDLVVEDSESTIRQQLIALEAVPEDKGGTSLKSCK